jgi:hypothetical protein
MAPLRRPLALGCTPERISSPVLRNKTLAAGPSNVRQHVPSGIPSAVAPEGTPVLMEDRFHPTALSVDLRQRFSPAFTFDAGHLEPVWQSTWCPSGM